MIDLFIKAVDKSIDLLREGKKNDKEFFELIVDPLFKEFSSVVEVYLPMFQFSRKTADELRQIRNEYLQSRIKVTELAQVYKTRYKDKDLADFLGSIIEFFYEPDHLYGRSSTEGKLLIDIVSGNVRCDFETDDLWEIVDQKRERLEKVWGKSVKYYGILQTKYQVPKI